PSAHVDAVRHVGYGHLVDGNAGPQARPYAPARLAMQLRDAVPLGREAQRQGRHAEDVAPTMVGTRQVLELLGAEPQLLPIAVEALPRKVEAEGIVTRSDGRVDGEHGVGRHQLTSLGEAPSLSDVLPAALERHERAVPLVHVPTRGPHAQGAQQAYASDAEYDLLRDAGALIAAVEAAEDAPVFLGVLRVVRVEQ